MIYGHFEHPSSRERARKDGGIKHLYVFISQIRIKFVYLQMNSWLLSLERNLGLETVRHRNGGRNPCRRMPEVAVRESADRDFQMTERQETDIHKAFINACAWPSKSRKFHVPSRQDSDRCPGDVMELMSPERNYSHDSQQNGTSWLRDCRIYGVLVWHIGVGSVRCSFDGTGQMREPRRWDGNG